MARWAFATVCFGAAVLFFFVGQAVENGGRIIFGQGLYMLSIVFGSCFVITVLPGKESRGHQTH